MFSSQYKDLISSGVVQPLEEVVYHRAAPAPLIRRLMAGGSVLPDANHHIAVHEFSAAAPQERSYCEPHQHECGEINLLLSWEQLVFRISLGDEIYTVRAPATVYIPARVLHSANVIEGTGFLIAILANGNYASTFASGALQERIAAAP